MQPARGPWRLGAHWTQPQTRWGLSWHAHSAASHPCAMICRSCAAIQTHVPPMCHLGRPCNLDVIPHWPQGDLHAYSLAVEGARKYPHLQQQIEAAGLRWERRQQRAVQAMNTAAETLPMQVSGCSEAHAAHLLLQWLKKAPT